MNPNSRHPTLLITSQRSDSIRPRLRLAGAALLLWLTFSGAAQAQVVNVTFNAATDIPITAASYSGTGKTLNITLNFAPKPGRTLTVVRNTGTSFITGPFSNVANGATVNLSYGGITYPFVAWYHGGAGRDLVLLWRVTKLAAWGPNPRGELGNGAAGSASPFPVAVDQTGVLAGKTVVQVSCGGDYSLALTSDGQVYAWGANNSGQLGNNDTTGTQQHVPVAVNTASGVSALFGKRVVAISAGGYDLLDAAWEHSLALCSDGTVAAWGYNAHGELGNNDSTGANQYAPVAVNTASGVSALSGRKVVAVSSGLYHSLALCSDGTVAAWGYDGFGELGYSNTSFEDQHAPVAVNTESGASALFGKKVVAISAGESHSLALCSDGTVVAWGDNYAGEIGDNDTAGRRVLPVAVNTASGVSALFGKTVVAVSAGGGLSLALCSDGKVAAWGDGFSGQLGNNDTTGAKQYAPVAVNTASGVSALFGKKVVAVSANGDFSLALCSDGTVASWGYNGAGQLGEYTTGLRQYAPVAVNTANGVSVLANACVNALSSGCFAEHSLAIFSPSSPTVPQLFVTSTGSGTAGVYNAVTGVAINPALVSGLAAPTGIVLLGNSLFVTNDSATTVGVYNATNGTLINTITGLKNPASLALSGNKLFVSNFFDNSPADNTVAEYNATTGAVMKANFITGLPSPQGLLVSGNVLYVANAFNSAAQNPGTGTVGIYNATTGVAINANFITGLNGPFSLALSGNNLFVSNLAHFTGTTVGKYNAATGVAIKADFIQGLKGPAGLAVSGNSLFVVNYGSGTVGEYNATTGALIKAKFIQGLTNPASLAIATTVTTSAAPAAGGSTSGSGTVSSGSNVTVVATPKAGYDFVNWTVGGTQVSASATCSFNVSASQTLVANFVLSANASLASLVTSAGPLTPPFASGTTSYTKTVTNTTDSITLTPKVAHAGATVTVGAATLNGGTPTSVASGSPSAPILLVPGPNIIHLIVTAPNGTTKKTYTIVITGPDHLTVDNWSERTVVRNLPAAAGAKVDLGTLTFIGGTGSIEASVNGIGPGWSVAKRYVIPIGYNVGTGFPPATWLKVLPTHDTGPYGVNDFDLDVNVSGATALLRLRTVGSNGNAATARISIKTTGLQSFANAIAAAAVPVPVQTVVANAVDELNGKAGIGGAPSAAAVLDVNGGDTRGLRLRLRSTPGAPSTGSWNQGTIILDSAANLFICTAAGTPGTWKKIGN